MSYQRYSPSAPNVPLVKGPNGRNLCRWCKTECDTARKTFCGWPCVVEWKIRTNGSFMRKQVYKRDKGICALCGFDARAFRNTVRRLPWYERRDFLVSLGYPGHRKTFWDADHIKAVVNGGGQSGLDNIRTLCIKCHALQTKDLVREERPSWFAQCTVQTVPSFVHDLEFQLAKRHWTDAKADPAH